MTRGKARIRQRDRGGIDELPSGALRVRVYAGQDPITKRRRYLTELIPAGTPKAGDEAEKVRTRLLSQVDERRHPRTSATLNQLLDRWLAQHTGERNTIKNYRGYLDKHVRPFLGEQKVGDIDAEVLDSLYADMRRCRDHCTSRNKIDHRTQRPHECDHRCGRHRCEGLKASGIRQVHFALSGAYKAGLRWRWVSVNPMRSVAPPSASAPNPQPPRAEQAAQLINEAFKDPDWGMFVWLTMTTGSRRGEMCSLRWPDLDLDNEVLALQRSIGQDGAETFEKDTKTHQRRHLVLDADTVAMLKDHRDHCRTRAAALGIELQPDGFVFSGDPDCSSHLRPNSVTQRYGRMAKRLGIATKLHALRHYSATELIAAGVDVRTVAGRLGHGGGGATTLRVYTAWFSESDQRAAGNLGSRLPARPVVVEPAERAKTNPKAAYERAAADIRNQILDGTLSNGDPIPTLQEMSANYGISVGTAHRAQSLLLNWGLTDTTQGRRPVAVQPVELDEAQALTDQPMESAGAELLDLDVVHDGEIVRKLRTKADPSDADELRRLLLDAAHRNGHAETNLGEYELNVRRAGKCDLLMTFVALSNS